MTDLGEFEVWLVTGSIDAYGEEALQQIADHSLQIGAFLDNAETVPVRVTVKPVVTTADAIRRVCIDANAAHKCVGVIMWMHTFSPAKMWIAGLSALMKPLLHMHTQFNRDLPWSEIDMDFMNLNQSAHGDREFAFIETRMRFGAEDGGRPLARQSGPVKDRDLGPGSVRVARGTPPARSPLR